MGKQRKKAIDGIKKSKDTSLSLFDDNTMTETHKGPEGQEYPEFLKAALRKKVLDHLEHLGFEITPEGLTFAGGKDTMRYLNREIRRERQEEEADLIIKTFFENGDQFAEGRDIDPLKIDPVLVEVETNKVSYDLFRTMGLSWSIPVHKGVCRRYRYLVRDAHNGKLMGLFGLGDQPIGRKSQDEHIGWDWDTRTQQIKNIMEGFCIGAFPPYNMLLCGKLVACLLKSKEVYERHLSMYGSYDKEEDNSRLLMVSTMSSMGRSSLYNRLKLDGEQFFYSVGYTKGFGTFQFSNEIVEMLRDFLRNSGDKLGFRGEGANINSHRKKYWISKAIRLLKFDIDITQHNIQREAFVMPLFSNSLPLLRGETGDIDLNELNSAQDIAQRALRRWTYKRAETRDDWRAWTLEDTRELYGPVAPKIVFGAKKSLFA